MASLRRDYKIVEGVKMIRIYDWMLATSVFDSQYGEISNIEFIRREAERIGRAKGRRVEIGTRIQGKEKPPLVCLWVDDIGGKTQSQRFKNVWRNGVNNRAKSNRKPPLSKAAVCA